MTRDQSRWSGFSLKELLELRCCMPPKSARSLNLSLELHSEIARRYDAGEKIEASEQEEGVAAAEAVRRWDGFSLKQLLMKLGRPVDPAMSRELSAEICRRYAEQDKKIEAQASEERIWINEADDFAKRSIRASGQPTTTYASTLEVVELRCAVRALIEHLREQS